MLKSYFKIAVRNLYRNRTYSFINIFGLGLGFATGFIMLLWVHNEYSMNRYHKNADRIYQVNARLKFGAEMNVWEHVPAPVTLYAREAISDIEKMVRVRINADKQPVKFDDKVFVEEKYGYSENELFEVFDFPVVKGNSKEPLAKGLSVVLTESTAKKYFGNGNPIGKIIRFRDTTCQVSAVMKDLPSNSSLQFDLLFSLDVARAKFRGNGQWKTIDQDWGNYSYSTFCLFRKNVGTAKASQLIFSALKKVYPETSVTEFPFRPLKDVYLYKTDGTKGRIILVEIFFIVAIFVLLIASINYINLVTAKATQRIKEIGIRKIVGAERQQLFWQFFIETGVLLFLAALVSVVLVQFFLPLYQQISNSTIPLTLENQQVWKVGIFIFFGIWLITGSYPALLLSSFKPLKSLKAEGVLSKTGLLRKTLVVMQFVVSLILLLGTVFIHRQMNFLQNHELGLNTDNVLIFPYWRLKDAEIFKNEIRQIAGVKESAVTNFSLFDGGTTTTGIEWPGKKKDEEITIARFDVDSSFMKFFHLSLKQGRGFERTTAGTNDFILNETAVKKMGLANPVGTPIKFNGQDGNVIGVVKDFYFESFHKELGAAIFQNFPENASNLYVRVQPERTKQVIASAEKIWKHYENTLPLEYFFLDEQINHQYDKENRARKLFDAFSFITLFISCLGLFGLATHSAERRVKEIGIRKVLGASLRNIATLLSKEFIVLVLIAMFVAIPIVYMGMNKLLQYFAYRISLQWWVFALACFGALFLAVCTVSVQAVKAGMANPVKSLKTE